MQRPLRTLLTVALALSLIIPALLAGSGSALADAPDRVPIDESLVLGDTAPDTLRNERVNVALVLAGEPTVHTFVAQSKAGASKADAANAQKARQADLAKAQAPVVAAITSKATSARLVSQHQALVNAVIVRVNRGEALALRGLPGVVGVHEVPDHQLDLTHSVPYIGAQRVATELGFSGRGMRIGIIDSGLDYTHRNNGGPGTAAAYNAAVTDLKAITETVTITATNGVTVTTKMFPTDKVAGGYDFVGDAWPNTPDGILEPDEDPIDPAHTGFTGGHGSHVAGITAGFGVPNASFNGSIPADSTFGGTTIGHGVAPAATIYAYKACSSVSTSCAGSAMIAGFERSADPNQDGDMSDHLDGVNMSIGSPFGRSIVTQAAADNAVLAGVAVAISAGNSADVPFIHGAPSNAPHVVSVANNYASNQFVNVLVVDAPAALAGRKYLMVQQAWAPQLSTTGPISGDMVYVGQACPGETLAADPAGKIALIIRGTCSVSLKADVVATAGALAAVVYNNVAGDLPPTFSFGGGNVTIPTVTINLAAGTALRAATGVQVTLSEAGGIPIEGFIAAGSSRGPALSSIDLKPSVSAPGSNIISTGASLGTGSVNNSGTSMAAPHVAGMFALIKQAHPTWNAQEISAAVVNTANPAALDLLGLDDAGNPRTTVVSLSRQGAGLVDAYKAVKQTTLAWVADNVASLSYGLQAVETSYTAAKSFTLSNKGTTARTYDVAFTPHVALPTGSTVTVSPTSVTVPAGATTSVNVTLTIAAAGLPTFSLINQAAITPSNLNRSEISGFVKATEQGGNADVVGVPVYAIARKASTVTTSPNALSLAGFGEGDKASLRLSNASANAGTAEVFSLLGIDPNENPGDDYYDLQYVGVRPTSVTSGGTTTQLLQFAIKTYGLRTLSFESQFQIMVDANRDGTADYRVFNSDIGATGTGTYDGRNATYVRNLATNALRGPFYFTGFTVGSSNAILTVAASEVGVTPTNQQFDFYALAFPNSAFPGEGDQAPDAGVYTYNPSALRFMHNDADWSIAVPANGSVTLDVYANARGFVGGDTAGRHYERGFLAVYSDNVSPGRDADAVAISFPFNFRVEQKTFMAQADLSGFVVNRFGGLDRQFGSGLMWTGVDNRAINPTVFLGVTSFSLGEAGSTVEFEEATLEITGADASFVDPRLDSRWHVDMLSSSVDNNLGRATFNMIALAGSDARLEPTLTDADLGVGRTNSFMLNAAAKAKLESRVRTTGRVTFRTSATPLYEQGMHLFAWDSRAATTAKAPVLRALTITRLP